MYHVVATVQHNTLNRCSALSFIHPETHSVHCENACTATIVSHILHPRGFYCSNLLFFPSHLTWKLVPQFTGPKIVLVAISFEVLHIHGVHKVHSCFIHTNLLHDNFIYNVLEPVYSSRPSRKVHFDCLDPLGDFDFFQMAE